ncbi:MAG: ABC-2 transporter permease [Lachnospiraceae bacterium]|nr:ABC-2 transporter permease [Lachnospiraceae bacterium]
MRGVLEKDYRSCREVALMGYAIAALLTVLIVLIPGIDPSNLIYLFAYFGVLVVMTTISEDVKNGYAYLMTYPIDAGDYVFAKLWFALGVELQYWLLSRVCLVAKALSDKAPLNARELLTNGNFYFISGIALLMLFLLVLLKCGVQGFFYLVGGFALLGVVFGTTFMASQSLVEGVVKIGSFAYFVEIVGSVAVLLTFLFAHLSVRVLEHKEF